jgi:hypothetical protein
MTGIMRRREFLARSALLAGAFTLLPRIGSGRKRLDALAGEDAAPDTPGIFFQTTDSSVQSRYQSALDLLAANVQVMPGYPKPVLIEGSVYRGIWLECAPHEGLVYSAIRPDIAHNNHLAFFELQLEDGQIPCNIKLTDIGHGQIQMVVPIAATAWELSRQTQDSQLLEVAYSSCSRWDAWLRRYRDTRQTGLCEGFCTYDTGHDNSPRWAGMPNRCPDGDARKCPPVPSLPRLCPDLSATVYGGRVALAAMARALGKNSEADHWLELAAAIRLAILDHLYDASDAAFYDLDARNRFVGIRGDVISRVLGEHVVDQKLFETIYQRQIHNPTAFWAPYPLPSIALDDPHFVRPIPRNSWGGASQALTALRAPRWMEHYGKPADLAYLMQQWVTAILRAADFRQQLDPLTGVFTVDASGYSPAALVLIDFTWRLAGVRKIADSTGDRTADKTAGSTANKTGNKIAGRTGDRIGDLPDDYLEWNIRPPAAHIRSSFRLRVTPTLTAEMKYESGHAELFLNGRQFLRAGSIVRLITTQSGELRRAAGIAAKKSSVVLHQPGAPERSFSIEPNSSLALPVPPRQLL